MDGPGGTLPWSRRLVDRQLGGEARARPMNAALDRTDRAVAGLSGLVIGNTRRTPTSIRALRMSIGQLGQRRAQVLVFQVGDLVRLDHQRFRVDAVDVLDLAAALAILGIVLVAQDGEEPAHHVRARLELVDIGAGAQQRLLRELVGPIAVPAQRDGEAAKLRHRFEHGGAVKDDRGPCALVPCDGANMVPVARRMNSLRLQWSIHPQ